MGLSPRIIVLAAIVAGLAVWIFVFDIPEEQRQLEESFAASQLLPIDPAAVDTLRSVHSANGFTIVRRDETWWITEPIVEPAETRTVESVIERLVRARSQRTMAPSLEESGWRAYGLEEGQAGRVDLILASTEGDRVELSVGNRIPAGTDYVYVRRGGSDALELASETVYDLANTNHQGFRRIDLFEIDDDAIVRLLLDGPGGRVAARRDTTSGLWFDAAARPGVVTRYKRWVMDDIALAVADQRVQAFLRDGLQTSDWAAYGLDSPWAEVRVTTADGREQTLSLGNERERSQYFARRDGLDTVFIVRPQFLGALDAGTTGLEDLNPIPMNLRNAFAFRVEEAATGRWAEIRPRGLDWVLFDAEGEVESSTYRQTAADNLARGLEEMQPERSLFMPSGGDPGSLLAERVAHVTIRFERSTLELHFGWREDDDDLWFYMQNDSSLYEVDREMSLRLRSFVDALVTDDAR